jgi:hypothetical protein
VRVRHRSLIAWVAAALLGTSGAEHAEAATITVVMTGELTAVADSNAVTDGSLGVGVTFTLTMAYEDTVLDSDADPFSGTFLIPGAAATYSISVGNYQFSSASALNISLLDGFFDPNEDTLSWFADQFSAVGAFDPGVALGAAGYSNTALYDYTGTALSSDQLTDVVWDRSLYEPDPAAFYLLLEILDPRTTGQDSLELQGTIDSMAVVLPEPSAALLIVLSATGLALRRRVG